MFYESDYFYSDPIIIEQYEENNGEDFFHNMIENHHNLVEIKDHTTQPTFANQDINNNNNNSNSIDFSSNPDDIEKENKMLQKKRNKNNSFGKYKGIHNKFSTDNVLRRIKSTLLNLIRIFINSLIAKTYKGKIKNGILKRELKKIDANQFKRIDDYKQLLNKTLKDIFSLVISKKYSNFLPEYNKNLINTLLKEKDKEKTEIFTKIFNLTFFQCLNHFSGTIFIDELKELKSIDEVCEDFLDEEYARLFRTICLEFVESISRKKSRNKNSS